MDVNQMAYRRSAYDNARRSLARSMRERDLSCPKCGVKNKPGAREVEIDDHDTAWCGKCSYNFAVQIALLFALLIASPAFAQESLVSTVKATLEANHVDLSGPCGAFQITKRVAWQLKDSGIGLLSKPSGNNCDGYAVDFLTYPDGSGVDMLGDAGGENRPAWNASEPPGALSGRWRAPIDPGDVVVPTPEPDPPVVVPVPVPDQPPVVTPPAEPPVVTPTPPEEAPPAPKPSFWLRLLGLLMTAIYCWSGACE